MVLGEFDRQPGLTDAMPTFKLKLPPPFEDAVKTMEREIMRFLMRSTGDRDDAMDLFQETWLRAYRAYPTLRSEDGLRPWIFRIASNLCRNRARDRTRRRIRRIPRGNSDRASGRDGHGFGGRKFAGKSFAGPA